MIVQILSGKSEFFLKLFELYRIIKKSHVSCDFFLFLKKCIYMKEKTKHACIIFHWSGIICSRVCLNPIKVKNRFFKNTYNFVGFILLWNLEPIVKSMTCNCTRNTICSHKVQSLLEGVIYRANLMSESNTETEPPSKQGLLNILGT